jgi:DNA mismatch repair protein MutS2
VAIKLAQQAAGEAEAKEARRKIEEAARAEGRALAAVDQQVVVPGGGGEVDVGRRVRLSSGGVGTVLEIRADGRASVALGAMKVLVPAGELVVLPDAPRAGRSHEARGDVAEASAPFEIDLRGLRGDEAEMATLAALDAAVLAENPYLRIIHGMGTGVVRETVRRLLKADRRVTRFDFAPRHQGGTGVTIAEFGGGP